jgi:hypothetical protein
MVMQVHHQRRIGYRLAALLTLAVLLAAWWPGQPVARAQENGEQDEPSIIYGQRAEIVFPAAIRFFVDVNAPPEQVTGTSLLVNQASGLQLTFALDPAEHLIYSTEQSASFEYTWQLNDGPSPAPFESLNYLWQVETQDGLVSRRAEEVLFEDTGRDDWNVAGAPPLVLHWYNETLAGGLIQGEVMAAYQALSRRTGRAPLFQFAIYDPDTRLCQTMTAPDTGEPVSVLFSREDDSTYPCSTELYERVYAHAGIVFLQRPSHGYTELQDLLIASIVRAAYAEMWGEALVPGWVANGLAWLYRLRPSLAALQAARTAARTESLLLLDDLANAPPDGASFQDRALWEAESYLLLLYLADRYGAETPFDLAREAPMYDDGFEGALGALLGAERDNLWGDWLAWLESEAADRALTWTPYTGTTPTPSHTPTNTPVPPTRTPSHTPTNTPTATSTFLGDRPPTVIVGRVTPTRARRPTNTPLPPGSLPTVTPRPTPEPVQTGGNGISGTAVGGIAVLVFGLALLIGLGIAVSRRR